MHTGLGGAPGRVVQLDPIKPKLKPPGTKLLKPEHETLVSKFAFKFNLCRYTLVSPLLTALHNVAPYWKNVSALGAERLIFIVEHFADPAVLYSSEEAYLNLVMALHPVDRQGFTVVHFSAPPEPFLAHNCTRDIP